MDSVSHPQTLAPLSSICLAQVQTSQLTHLVHHLNSAELTCLIICGSVPTLKPLYDQLFNRKRPASTATYVSSAQKPLAYPRPMQQVYYSPLRPGFASPPSSSFASADVFTDGRRGNTASFV